MSVHVEKGGNWCKFRGANEQLRAEAMRIYRSALHRGDLVRQSCEICGAPKTEGHHEDYAQPLNVIWLCRIHHAWRHTGDSLDLMREYMEGATA